MLDDNLRKLKDFDKIYQEFSWDIPEFYNIAYDVCDRHASASGKIALYYYSDTGQKKVYTFSQLKSLSNRFANALVALGVKPKDFIAIYLGQRPEAAIAHLAVFKIGAISVPMSPMFGPDAIEYRINNCHAKVIIFGARDSEKIVDIRNKIPSIEYLIEVDGKTKGTIQFEKILTDTSETFDMARTSADDPAILVYTSGTSGFPKGALHAHRCIPSRLTGLEMAHNFFPLKGDLFWSPADWAWIGGLFDSLFAPWCHGIPVVAIERKRFDPERVFAQLEKYSIRNSFLPPTALKIMKEVPRPKERYRLKMRSVHSGGEIVSPDILEWGKEVFTSLAEIYGMTEIGFVAGNCPVVLPIKPGSMGKAYPGHKVEVFDKNGKILPPGKIGEVAIHRSDLGMFLGYWGDEKKTNEKFSDDWFFSGDLAFKDDEGYFWYQTRKDDVIISAGYRFGPSEIERCIFKHTSVQDVTVVGSPDPLRGEVAKAFIVLTQSVAPSDSLIKEIQTLVKNDLSAHEYPREIEFVSEFPRTTTGKIQRDVLRQQEIERKA